MIGAILLSSSGFINTILYSKTRTDLLFPAEVQFDKNSELESEGDEQLPQGFELHPMH